MEERDRERGEGKRKQVGAGKGRETESGKRVTGRLGERDRECARGGRARVKVSQMRREGDYVKCVTDAVC